MVKGDSQEIEDGGGMWEVMSVYGGGGLGCEGEEGGGVNRK